LSTLNISSNSKLVDLYCSHNQLSSINTSIKLYLRHLYCGYNQITSLDISRSYDLWILDVTEMPTLTEVCVWEMPFPPEHVLVNAGGSSNTYFTDVCSN